jgi:hypothetical protein
VDVQRSVVADSATTSLLLAFLLAVCPLTFKTRWKSSHFEWSQLSDLNRRPTVYKTVALPLS